MSYIIKGFEIDALPVGWGIDGAAAPGALTTLTSTNKINYRAFAGDTTDDDLFFEWQVPYGIDETILLLFQVEGWIINATPPGTSEAVVFSLAGASIGDNDLLSSALGTAVLKTKTFSVQYAQYDKWISGWSTGVTITGLTVGETVILNLKRLANSDAADDYAQSIGVSWLKIKYARKLQVS